MHSALEHNLDIEISKLYYTYAYETTITNKNIIRTKLSFGLATGLVPPAILFSEEETANSPKMSVSYIKYNL